MLEAHLMLMEGVPPAMIENVAKMAGLPVGPLALTDETGVDLAYKILKATEADLGAGAIDAGQKKLIETLVVKEQRFGRKNGKGFYDYPASGPKSLWPGLGGNRRQGARPGHDQRPGLKGPVPVPAGARGRALHVRRRRHRSARGRRRLDPRLRLRALYGRHAVVHRRHGPQGLRGAGAGACGQPRPALRPAGEADRNGGKGRDVLRNLRREEKAA